MTDQQILEAVRPGMRFKHSEWTRHDGGAIVPADCIVTRVRDGRIHFCRSASDGGAMLETETSTAWSDFAGKMATPARPASRLPLAKFVEVPYWSFPDWLGIDWKPGAPMDRPLIGGPRADAVRLSTAWETLGDYTRATGRTECPEGFAWLVPGPTHKLAFLTGVTTKPVTVGGARRRWKF